MQPSAIMKRRRKRRPAGLLAATAGALVAAIVARHPAAAFVLPPRTGSNGAASSSASSIGMARSKGAAAPSSWPGLSLVRRAGWPLAMSLRAFDLESLTVDQLRDALKRRGLKTTGKKAELLARLRQGIQEAQAEERGRMMQGMEEEEGKKEEAEAEEEPDIKDTPPSASASAAASSRAKAASTTRRGKGAAATAAAAALEQDEDEDEDEDEDDGMSLEDRLIESLAAEVRASQQRQASGKDESGGGSKKRPSSSSSSSSEQPPLLDTSAVGQHSALTDREVRGEGSGEAAAAATGELNDVDFLLESMPDEPRNQPQHQIKQRHVGWDGALEGYTLADGTYVNVKEDPRLSDKDRAQMEEKFRRELLRWETDYPEKWQELLQMCDEAAARKATATVAAAVERAGDGEADEEQAAALERQVAEIAKLEAERKLATLPMAAKMEEWEAARMAQAVPVESPIDPAKLGGGGSKGALTTTTPVAEGEDVAGAMDVRAVADVEEAEEEGKEEKKKKKKKEVKERRWERPVSSSPMTAVEDDEEEEAEYVPIDAMFRDELDVNTADGDTMKGYLVSSKLAQKFWRRSERPVVLLLTDDRGWRSVPTRKLADHLAFLTNHVVFVPDLYRGDAWDGGGAGGEGAQGGESLQAFRARHSPMRLLQDARAAMEALVRNYNATATGIVGFGVGGGQALSAVASGFLKTNAVVAVDPCGYNAANVAGAMQTPSLVVVAGEDSPEAPLADVVTLMDGFGVNKALPHMIRVFRDCHHGFVTRPRRGEEEKAEDAVMLATSWLEIQLRRGKAKLIRDSRVV